MDVQLNDRRIAGCSITMVCDRKIDRVLTQDQEGEDIIDHGRGSYEFHISGNLGMEDYRRFLEEVAVGPVRFKSDLGEFDVVIKSIRYKDDGRLHIHLVEDIMPET
jgi:hypothetical protein